MISRVGVGGCQSSKQSVSDLRLKVVEGSSRSLREALIRMIDVPLRHLYSLWEIFIMLTAWEYIQMVQNSATSNFGTTPLHLNDICYFRLWNCYHDSDFVAHRILKPITVVWNMKAVTLRVISESYPIKCFSSVAELTIVMRWVIKALC